MSKEETFHPGQRYRSADFDAVYYIETVVYRHPGNVDLSPDDMIMCRFDNSTGDLRPMRRWWCDAHLKKMPKHSAEEIIEKLRSWANNTGFGHSAAQIHKILDGDWDD